MTIDRKLNVLARRHSARVVAEAFMPAERGVEQAAIDGAHCIQVMIDERKKSRLHADVGADELVLVARGVTLALESYRAFATAHRTLIKIPAEHHMDEQFGPSCGENGPVRQHEDGVDRIAA